MTAETEHQRRAAQHDERCVDVGPEAELSAAWG
jgi:hypothetical protein